MNDWFDPWLTDTDPLGEIVPPVPAEAVMVYVFTENVALIVWFAVTLLKLYELTAPTDAPSTRTLVIW